MRPLKQRLQRLEECRQLSDQPFTNVRNATDAQLEAFLRSAGVDPHDERALALAAQTDA